MHRCSCKRGRGLNEPEMITKIITELAASYPNACVCLVTQSSLTLCDPTDCSSPGSSVHGDSPGKNTGVNGHALLQGIFPIQGSNLFLSHLPHWQMGSLPTGTTWEAQTMYYRPEITIFLISSTILENKCHVHFTEDKTETWGSEITSG